jgi:ceramide glucosyltransferase
MIETLLLLLIISSWTYWLLAWWWTRSFFMQPEADASFAPGVSLLKPLRGVDVEAYENLTSFCKQDYPEFELLCGVADPSDPAVAVVQRLQRGYPDRRIRLIVAPPTGSNQKASILHQLALEARHQVLVISDSDMRVTPDYLRRVVAPLSDERVGLVTCPYRGRSPLTFTARLEALHMTATFLPSVIVARRFLEMRFAMGATVALRQGGLAQVGGFAAFADYLADDYQLAVRLAALGQRVQLSQYVVESVLGATSFREQWDREVRWQRTNRVNRPGEYPGMLLTFSTPLSVILVLVSGLAPVGWASLATSVILRWLLAWLSMGYAGDRAARSWLIWLPVRDLLSALVWCVGSLGRRIVWRGEEYALQPGGRMVALPGSEPPEPEGDLVHEVKTSC